MYRESNAKFPYPSELLCHVLTPSCSVGNAMCQYILRVDGKVFLPRSTVRPSTTDELNSTTHACRRQAFDLGIKRKLSPPPTVTTSTPDEWVAYDDDDDTYFQQPETDNLQYDELINVKVFPPHRDKKNLHATTVIGHTKDSKGNEKGRYHLNESDIEHSSL